MFATTSHRGRLRLLLTGMLALVLAGCQGVIPSAPEPGPDPVDVDSPSASVLPDSDEERHRVALLVPLSGQNAAVGQSLSNATTMALLDTNTANIRITSYDTAAGAAAAARQAIADGNQLVLGPLLADNIDAIDDITRRAGVPLLSFSNDTRAAGGNVFIMGQVPAQAVDRTMRHAIAQGVRNFGALIPTGDYGDQVADAMLRTARATNTRVVAVESYDRSSTALASATNRLLERDDIDGLMIADGARMAVRAAPLIRDRDRTVRLLGTELWSGEAQIAQSSALRGAWFSALSDGRFQRFSDSYRQRFGAAPYRIATLGYDAVLLTIRVSRDWQPGDPFPVRMLSDAGGFVGVDGAFRFSDGIVQRRFEVREVKASGVEVVSPAPAQF